ncbi:MAG TPA: CBS domain-containing protein [Ktedonosporobacter sp.]|nr:CBS domain-containing protein [Ktedonosporobacter sp.]
MLYLSQLLGAPVTDQHSVRVGKITDVLLPVARNKAEEATRIGQVEPIYPSALLVEGEADQPWRIPLHALERREGWIHLLVPLEQLSPQAAFSTDQEISLAHEVLDKQVIDVKRKKAVRVNDICLADDWQVLGVDSSTLGLMRRLAPSWLLGARGSHAPATLIPWERIELIGSTPPQDREGVESVPPPQGAQQTSQRPQSGPLAELHPADIAEIVQQLSAGQGARLIERLDDETAADTMEEINTERQSQILENIEVERAADILQAMGPDEAADLLAQLPEERAQQLLRLMNPEESEEVQELLEYEADTAGGLMTTDYTVLNQTRTVAEALAAVRSDIQKYDVRIAYVYCVADETQDENRVLGVVSLWDLLVAQPTQMLQDLMETDVITVQADSDPRSVAEIIAKYNLLAVPVVSTEGIIEGVITVDDVLDVLLPPERRRKPRRMY